MGISGNFADVTYIAALVVMENLWCWLSEICSYLNGPTVTKSLKKKKILHQTSKGWNLVIYINLLLITKYIIISWLVGWFKVVLHLVKNLSEVVEGTSINWLKLESAQVEFKPRQWEAQWLIHKMSLYAWFVCINASLLQYLIFQKEILKSGLQTWSSNFFMPLLINYM